MTNPADRHLAFLHRFQQRRLGLWRRAVDFVGQHDVGKQRPFHESHSAMARRTIFFDDFGARHVRRHQVRRELNPAERQIERPRQRADHQRFGQPRNTFQQAMALREQTDQDFVDHVTLADDHFTELDDDLVPCLAQPRRVFGIKGQRIRGVTHERTGLHPVKS